MPAMAGTMVVAVPAASGDPSELIAMARRLGNGNAALVGGAGDGAGADEVHVVGGAALEVPDVRAWALALASVCAALQPSLVLFGDDAFDRAVASYLAQRIGGGVVTGVTALRDDGRRLIAERAVLSGSGVETCAIRPGVLPVVCMARGGARASAVDAPVADAPTTRHVVDQQAAATVVDERPSSGPGLRRARTVRAGGAGVGGPEGMAALRALAETLGAGTAASRGAIVNGWATAAEKVGLTGVSVTPELYLAVGISGASQHMAGCRRARVLVAVNSDRGAPIFRYARYGIVADSRAVLDALRARLTGVAS
jgi:electron transfer flavoprotein alpha subunit